MSLYRDSLTPAEQSAYDASQMAAAQDYADYCAERDALAAVQGAQAVAEAAHYPGHPLTAGQIARQYEAMRDNTRRAEVA